MNRMIPAGLDGKDKRDGCSDEISCACHGHEFHGVRNGDELTSASRRTDLGRICPISKHKN